MSTNKNNKDGNAVSQVQEMEATLVNPHVPEYMTKRPFYLGEDSGEATLEHQKRQKKEKYDNKRAFDDYKRVGVDAPQTWVKYGLGARSRASKQIVDNNTDRKVKKQRLNNGNQRNYNLSYDAKRDRYNGYDPKNHQKTIARFDKLAEIRKGIRAEERKKRAIEKEKRRKQMLELKKKRKEENGGESDSDSDSDSSSSSSSSSSDDSDEDSDDDEVRITDHQQKNMTGGGGKHVGAKSSQVGLTMKNLRQREDTAKYLLNLNPNSAYYDPKSRSMRANPNPGLDASESVFVGDNVARISGDAVKMAQTQVFAWEQYSNASTSEIVGNPTELALARKKFVERANKVEKNKKNNILAKYGGEEHLMKPPRELLLGANENYVEYSADGRVIKGQVEAIPKSKYEEDVYLNNHTSIWGSYYDQIEMKWGYECCWQCVKNSYCVGDALKPPSSSAIINSSSNKTSYETQNMNNKIINNNNNNNNNNHHVNTSSIANDGNGNSKKILVQSETAKELKRLKKKERKKNKRNKKR